MVKFEKSNGKWRTYALVTCENCGRNYSKTLGRTTPPLLACPKCGVENHTDKAVRPSPGLYPAR